MPGVQPVSLEGPAQQERATGFFFLSPLSFPQKGMLILKQTKLAAHSACK